VQDSKMHTVNLPLPCVAVISALVRT